MLLLLRLKLIIYLSPSYYAKFRTLRDVLSRCAFVAARNLRVRPCFIKRFVFFNHGQYVVIKSLNCRRGNCGSGCEEERVERRRDNFLMLCGGREVSPHE